MFSGYLDRLEFIPSIGWAAVGWACDSEQPDCPVMVEVTSGDQVVGRATANILREDVREAGIGTGHHGFVAAIALDVPRERCARCELGLRYAGNLSEICAPIGFDFNRVVGQIEGYRNMLVHGWACDTSRPEVPLSIDILVDGVFTDRVVADHPREDLASYFSACYGFFWSMPLSLADGKSRRISARVSEDGSLLPGSPLVATVENWQVPHRLQVELMRQTSMRTQIKAGKQALFFEKWRVPDEEVVTTMDFLLDRIALPSDL